MWANVSKSELKRTRSICISNNIHIYMTQKCLFYFKITYGFVQFNFFI